MACLTASVADWFEWVILGRWVVNLVSLLAGLIHWLVGWGHCCRLFRLFNVSTLDDGATRSSAYRMTFSFKPTRPRP